MKWVATLAVAAAAVGFSSAQSRCSPPYEDYEPGAVTPKCLWVLPLADTWQKMLDFCEQFNGTLAMVNGDLHNAVYTKLTGNTDFNDMCFWIGGTDAAREGTWVWQHDGSSIPLGGPHWLPCPSEPNGGTTENYLAICPQRYYYSDYPGSSKLGAICQDFN